MRVPEKTLWVYIQIKVHFQRFFLFKVSFLLFPFLAERNRIDLNLLLDIYYPHFGASRWMPTFDDSSKRKKKKVFCHQYCLSFSFCLQGRILLLRHVSVCAQGCQIFLGAIYQNGKNMPE
jgi:hypothetical protein